MLVYRHVTVTIDRNARAATFIIKGPSGDQPQDTAAIEAQGANWYPLALARELEDAILSMRTNELDIGLWLMKSEGDLDAVLAMDATLRALQRPLARRAKRSAICAARSAGSTSLRAACSR